MYLTIEEVIKLTEIYSGIKRRNREDYILHCLRVAKSVSQDTPNTKMALLAALHDALEVCNNVDYASLVSDFGLDKEDLKVMEILTANSGESSQEHFERVLESKDSRALVIKYYDCKDNSEFTFEDFEFTKTFLNKDPVSEQKKYLARMEVIKSILGNIGIIID